MNERMPCHISDGPQLPEDVRYSELEDEDAAYERDRQRAIDEVREEIDLQRENDEELDREAREVIRAERARLEAPERNEANKRI